MCVPPECCVCPTRLLCVSCLNIVSVTPESYLRVPQVSSSVPHERTVTYQECRTQTILSCTNGRYTSTDLSPGMRPSRFLLPSMQNLEIIFVASFSYLLMFVASFSYLLFFFTETTSVTG